MNPTAPLELRPIEYESLDDGEADDPVKPKPARPGLFNRAKAAMTGSVNRAKKVVGSPSAELGSLLPLLRAMSDRWKEIGAEHARETDVSAYTAHVQAARQTFAAEKSLVNHER